MVRGMKFLWLFLLFPMLVMGRTTPAFALETPDEKLPSAQQERLAEKIGQKLRCPVCQNANIEESNAPLAKTLRTAIRQQVSEGKNEAEILNWMQERYGDFIFLTPPFSRYSVLLWVTPLVSLLIGIALFLIRRQTSISGDKE